MSKHLSLRSGNPALSSKTFSDLSKSSSNFMTLDGTVNKSILSLLILVGVGSLTFSPDYYWLIWPGFIGGFIVALITIFKKNLAPITVPIYAALEGAALGAVSNIYANAFYPGIVMQSILLTVGIFAALLFAYKTKIIAPTQNFKLGIFAATGGIMLFYVISIIFSLFTKQAPPMLDPTNASIVSILFSVFVVIIAALNLVLDFDFIEEGVEKGAPKYMEWYGAFGLLVTLVWLYLEILRLLAKLNSRR